MTQDAAISGEFFLAGYLKAFEEGFAVPCYLTQPDSEVWHVAVCSPDGDHDGIIIRFDAFESDEIETLPVDRHIAVSVGSVWQDVFLWNKRAYVGRPETILDQLSGHLTDIAFHAPISLLDLALSAGDTNPRPLVRGAFEHISLRHGRKVANTWLRDTLVLEQGRLITRRHLAATGQTRKLSEDVRLISVQAVDGKFRVVLPKSISSELEKANQLAALEEQVDILVDRMADDIGYVAVNKENLVKREDAIASEKTSLAMDARPRLLTRLLNRVGLTLQTTDQLRAAEANARMADQMRELARTDVVTGLVNRAGLNHDMVQMLAALPEGKKLAMLWLDLDRFKEINDALGHPIGDKVLAEVGSRLRTAAPEGACVARFGGDEFIVVAQVGDRSESEHLARALADGVAQPTRIEGHRVDIAASLGVALLPDDASDIDTLMQGADLALYHSKIGGRNQICFFDNSMTRELVRKRLIEAELRAAIQSDELAVFFQPIVDLDTGKIRTFEALVRWFHPEKGELRPDEFIPVAEESDLIILLGRWVVRKALEAAAKWPDDVTIAVNLSPVEIRAPGAALGILNALRDANVSPDRLELEVTEALFLEDNDYTTLFMEELSAKGVRFSLDDFGTGYSSLAYINRLPFKKIKVDRSFVSGLNVGKKSEAIIRAVSEMGATLDMDIVAEGIETVEQVQTVRRAGCTLGQGFYFARALPDYLAEELLAQELERSAIEDVSPKARTKNH